MPAIGGLGWAASIVTGTVICTWLFNSTSGSIAVLAVFHASLYVFVNSPRRYGRKDLSASPKVTRTRPSAKGSAHEIE